MPKRSRRFEKTYERDLREWSQRVVRFPSPGASSRADSGRSEGNKASWVAPQRNRARSPQNASEGQWQESSQLPDNGSVGSPQEGAAATDRSGPLCPLLGRPCLGPNCVWWDGISACQVVTLSRGLSEMQLRFQVLHDKLDYLMKRLG